MKIQIIFPGIHFVFTALSRKITFLIPNLAERLEQRTIDDGFFNMSQFLGFWTVNDRQAIEIRYQNFNMRYHITYHGFDSTVNTSSILVQRVPMDFLTVSEKVFH
jgi:hypothetical protein